MENTFKLQSAIDKFDRCENSKWKTLLNFKVPLTSLTDVIWQIMSPEISGTTVDSLSTCQSLLSKGKLFLNSIKKCFNFLH